MKEKTFRTIKFLGLTLGIALSIFAISFAVYAWTAPTAAPPGGNVPAPINVGDTAQTKTGPLRIDGVFRANSAVHLAVGRGNVGIGTTAPTGRLHVRGGNAYIDNINFGGIPTIALAVGDTDTGLHSTADGALDVFSNNVNTMSIRSGNVGIGTTGPTTRLDVNGQIRIRGGTPGAGRVLTSDAAGLATWRTMTGLPTGTSGQTLRHDGASWLANSLLTNTGTRIGINTATPGGRLSVLGEGTTSATFAFNAANSAGTSMLFVRDDGRVGIGTTAPAQRLHVAGNVLADAYFHTSDRNLKTGIKPLENNLVRILNLNPVSFRWRENNENGLGLIAQDIENIFPEIVHIAEDSGLKSVNYNALIAPLIQAIQEQQEQIESQQEQIGELKIKIGGPKE